MVIKTTYIDHMGSDLSVVNAARVSFNKVADNYPTEANDRLIKYLAKHKHISPFGHAFASFHVKAPIFVARQLVKHKFLRWNEISRRYVDSEPEFYVPDVWRKKADNVKQGSSDEAVESMVFGVSECHPKEGYGTLLDYVTASYRDMLDAGVAPEQARMVLPQSTMTEWIWSGSLDAFASMCKLRCKPDTQYESQVVANQISEMMGTLFPVSWAALMENNND